MNLTTFLEALIGLVFIYVLSSVFCAALNELIAQESGRRGKFLREGLLNIVSDRWIYLRLINQPLVSSLYRDVPGKPRTPSYIPSANFAVAVLDTMVLKAAQINPARPAPPGPATFDDVRAAVVECRNAGYTTGDAILPLLDAAGGDLDKARANVAAWYESGMERVSGWYKKHTRRVLFAIGLGFAVLFNVDTLQIVTQLAQSSTLRKSLADAATRAVETGKFSGVAIGGDQSAVKVETEELRKIAAGLAAFEQQGLPVGFSCLGEPAAGKTQAGVTDIVRSCWTQTKSQSTGSWLMKLIGWFVTALAITFGAPFWFDLLNRLVDLRGSGKKPAPEPEKQK